MRERSCKSSEWSSHIKADSVLIRYQERNPRKATVLDSHSACVAGSLPRFSLHIFGNEVLSVAEINFNPNEDTNSSIKLDSAI